MSLLSGTDLTLVLSVFVASAVESVEAVTIVLAAGTARNMRSALQGAFSALLTLAVIVAIFGRTLTNIPEETLRFTIGILLFFFGLQWLRKATLRYGGVIALHDEAKIFQEEIAVASRASTKSLVAVKDWFAFTMSYKGVFLEGVEVAFIVISFASIRVASNPDAMLQASLAAIGAALAAALAGLIIDEGPRELIEIYCWHHVRDFWSILDLGGNFFAMAHFRTAITRRWWVCACNGASDGFSCKKQEARTEGKRII